MTSQNKTRPEKISVEIFLEKVEDQQKREDSKELVKIMSKISGRPAVMWGTSIVGFDSYHYKYESGREGDMCVVGFSPRREAIAIYLTNGLGKYEKQLKELGKHKAAKTCLYIKKLSDVNIKILEDMIADSYKYVKSKDGEMHWAV